MSIRKSVVSGSFYPDNKKELLDTILKNLIKPKMIKIVLKI
jgi:predicted class III extradiol MEMO1 family dioxygenase